MDTPTYRAPKSDVFKNNSDDWLVFRRLRFAQTGDGQFAVVRDLNLTGSNLRNFPADHIAFVHCNLDNTIFSDSRLAYATTFIDCSMKNVDFKDTAASDALFLNCDLTDAQFPTEAGWATVNLDGNTDYSVFSNCTLPTSIDQYLVKDGNITDSSKLTPEKQLTISENISDRLTHIIAAPVIEA